LAGREQHDLSRDAERPKRSDRGAVKTACPPVEGGEAVKDRVARLDEAGGCRNREKGRIAPNGAGG
jgi:hypothetical protein